VTSHEVLWRRLRLGNEEEYRNLNEDSRCLSEVRLRYLTHPKFMSLDLSSEPTSSVLMGIVYRILFCSAVKEMRNFGWNIDSLCFKLIWKFYTTWHNSDIARIGLGPSSLTCKADIWTAATSQQETLVPTFRRPIHFLELGELIQCGMRVAWPRNRRRFLFPTGQEVYLSTLASEPSLVPNQPTIQCVLGLNRPKREAEHSCRRR
jgi:hypothetical protein